MGNSIDKRKYVHKLKSGKYCVSIPFHCNKTEYNGDIGYGFYIIKKEFDNKYEAVYNADLFIVHVLKK